MCQSVPQQHRPELEQAPHADLLETPVPRDRVHTFNWPSPELAPLKFGGSHDLGLTAARSLAEQLGQLSRQVTIWVVEGRSTSSLLELPETAISLEVELALRQIISLIQSELSQA